MEVHDVSRIGGGTEAARVRVWRRPKNSSNTVIPNCGHLVSKSIRSYLGIQGADIHQIPQEGPHELGKYLIVDTCSGVSLTFHCSWNITAEEIRRFIEEKYGVDNSKL